MTFAKAGSIITQSGTDQDLSGLAAIAGVTTLDAETSGSGSNKTKYTAYSLGANTLSITGDLYLDPKKESLILNKDEGIIVQNSAQFHVGRKTTQNGYEIVGNPLTAIIGTAPSSLWWDGALLRVKNGGSAYLWGSSVYSAGSFIVEDGGWAELVDSTFISNDEKQTIAGRGYISWIKSQNVKIKNFAMIHGELVFSGNGRQAGIDGITRKQAKIGMYCTSINEITLKNMDIGNHGNIIDYAVSTNPGNPSNFIINNTRIINEKSGTDLIVLGVETGADPRNKGRLEVRKELHCEVIDHDGSPIQGARFFIKDTDHGHRKNLNGYDDTADKTYTTVSDAQGKCSAMEVITGIINVEGGTVAGDAKNKDRGTSNTSPYDWDLRGNSNIPGEDMFTYHCWSYLHLHSAGTVSLKGLGDLTVSQKMFDDKLVTEKSQITVDAYPAINSAYMLYDVAKSHLTKLHHMQHQDDSHDLMLTRDGRKIITFDKNLTIDKNAAQAFDYDDSTDTITIKADVFDGDIDTGTGRLSLLNGASIKPEVVTTKISSADIERIAAAVDSKADASASSALIKGNLDRKISDLHDFDYRNDPVDVSWINGTAITTLDQLKNTASEIAAGTEKGLRELDQAEKNKYKADTAAMSAETAKIGGMEAKIDAITNDITRLVTDAEIIRKVKLNDYDMVQISETEQRLTVYTDATRSSVYAQATVKLEPSSNKRSMTWSKVPS